MNIQTPLTLIIKVMQLKEGDTYNRCILYKLHDSGESDVSYIRDPRISGKHYALVHEEHIPINPSHVSAVINSFQLTKHPEERLKKYYINASTFAVPLYFMRPVMEFYYIDDDEYMVPIESLQQLIDQSEKYNVYIDGIHTIREVDYIENQHGVFVGGMTCPSGSDEYPDV